MARCGALLAEGPAGTLEEGGVCLPGTSVLLSAGFFNTWFPWHPAAAVHGGQQYRAPPQGQESPEQPHRAVLLMQHSQRMASPEPSRQLLPVQEGPIPRVLLAWSPQPTALLPSEPQLHPILQGMDLSSVGGSLLGVVAAPNTRYSSLQFLLFTGQSSIPPILCHI